MCKYNPRVDFIFKKMFGVEENKALLIDLINSIIDEEDKVSEIIIKNPYNEKNFREDKLSILDIKAKDELTGKWFNIEMQVSKQDEYDKRALYYWARTYVNQLSSGINYDLLTKTISINFLNFSVVPEEKYHNTYRLINVESGKEFIDQLEIHFIELEKYDSHKNAKTLLDKWTYFLKEAGMFEVFPKELEDVSTIKRAMEILENISMNAEERESYENKLKWLRDEEGAIKTAKREGIEEGIKEGKIETAKNLLSLNADISFIVKATGLTEKEVLKIEKEMKKA